MKRLLSLTIIAASFAFAFVACKDDFNEEDFLRVQSELKLKQDEVIRQRIDSASEEAVKEYIAAANEAGDLLAVSLVVRENGNALEGVTVTLSSGTPNEIASGRAKATTTGTTDASGMVVFDRVTIGAGTAVFSKQGYVTATAIYDFGLPENPVAIQVSTPNGSTVTKYVPPRKKFEEAAVSMISATPSSSSTATITGRVTIENDLTNTTPEVPAGIVLRANLTNLITNDQGFFKSYTLADNSSLGRATIAADGTYTMVVPATADGTNISFIVPNIQGTSKMAVNSLDDGTGTAVMLANGPEYHDVPTSWGPQALASFGTTIPTVAGAKLVFPAAPPAGSGLTFDFTPVPRDLILTNATSFIISSAQLTAHHSAIYKILRRGRYSNGAIPSVTVLGGDGSANATAEMRTYISALSVTATGTGYNGNIVINLVRVNNADVETAISSIVIPSLNGGLPATINLASFAGTNGFDPQLQVTLANDTKALKVAVVGNGSGATVAPTFQTEVDNITVTNGKGFTTAPTFVFSGGGLADGSPDHAAIEVADFAVNWIMEPNNSASTDYAIVPNFLIRYSMPPIGNALDDDTQVAVFSQSGNNENLTATLQSRLTVSSGDIVKREPSRSLRTLQKSGKKPTVIVTTQRAETARKVLTASNFNSDGSISSFPAANSGSNGNGYDVPLTVTVEPAIAGAPGSGASISVTNSFDATTLEYTWDGSATINSAGSGYLPNLNRKAVENATFPGTISVQSGKTYNVDVKYGTGTRLVSVN